ncbi:LOW QUALITY PROTEIN: Cyclophilin-type peptidyl-prolyl cis-trans isomerase domain [Dillenia turbinata]|uniref:RING-type E3 ubiquitin transferase n=1 Tax=Dillenia turbinata TaxID=194707 RepID=A0AAN8Z3D9_9MAGN
MGKKQHSKDRMFITKTEWATEWGGAKSKLQSTPFKRLPFYSCALTFTPLEDAVCTKDGGVFDIMNIIPYIKKYGKHPVSSAPLKEADLVPLTFHKNLDGSHAYAYAFWEKFLREFWDPYLESTLSSDPQNYCMIEYHCPVLNKVFTEFTHIVAVKTAGNVHSFVGDHQLLFSFQPSNLEPFAIKKLNIKTKNWKELLTDEPFSREDLMTIQNPNALDMKVLLNFDHVKNSLKLEDEDLKKMISDPTYNIKCFWGDQVDKSLELRKRRKLHFKGGGSKARNERAAALAAILASRSCIEEDSKSDGSRQSEAKQAYHILDAASASVLGISAAAAKAASSDQTAARIAMHMAGERAPVNAKLIMNTVMTQSKERVKSHFPTSAASRSFTSTSYDPMYFWHAARNFMIQGGDPTGSRRGGLNMGKPFKDELNSKSLHSERGVVGVANGGPHNNGSQFFILYKLANHLNFKHSVFGKVVGGLTTLTATGKVPVDDDDRPLEEIKIITIKVFVNPYTEPDEEEEESAKEKNADDEEKAKVGAWYSNPGTNSTTPGSVGGGVGNYLKARSNQDESVAAGTNLQENGAKY